MKYFSSSERRLAYFAMPESGSEFYDKDSAKKNESKIEAFRSGSEKFNSRKIKEISDKRNAELRRKRRIDLWKRECEAMSENEIRAAANKALEEFQFDVKALQGATSPEFIYHQDQVLVEDMKRLRIARKALAKELGFFERTPEYLRKRSLDVENLIKKTLANRKEDERDGALPEGMNGVYDEWLASEINESVAIRIALEKVEGKK